MGRADDDLRTLEEDLGVLPAVVLALKPRLREVATIVYLNGGPATARDVEECIAETCSRSGVRTMLNRLAKRGILTRRRSGAHIEFVYLPAIQTKQVREIALRRFVERNYDGSASTALQSTLRLMSSEQVRQHYS